MAATVAEVMNSKFQGLSESLSKFDEKLDRKFAELLAAIRLLTSSRTVGASSSGDRCPPSHSQVLQPPVHDLARIDKRSLSDDVSDGVVAKKCSLGTDFLNPILCESFPIEVLRSADGGLKECKSESAIINKTEKITITEDDTNYEGSLNDVLDEPAAINDVEPEVNMIDACSCDARLLDVVSNKQVGVEEVKPEVNYATIQFNNSPGLSSCKDSRAGLAKSVYKPVYQVVICSVTYCSPTVRLNAHEKLVLYFLRAKPPDMNMNRRTRHGLVLSSIQQDLINPRTCPEVCIMDIEAPLGLWCSEAPRWPPDFTKYPIMDYKTIFSYFLPAKPLADFCLQCKMSDESRGLTNGIQLAMIFVCKIMMFSMKEIADKSDSWCYLGHIVEDWLSKPPHVPPDLVILTALSRDVSTITITARFAKLVKAFGMLSEYVWQLTTPIECFLIILRSVFIKTEDSDGKALIVVFENKCKSSFVWIIRELQVGNTLPDMYGNCSSVVYMSRIYDAMDVKDRVTRTTLIAGYVRNSCNLKAIESFKEAHTGVQDIDPLMILMNTVKGLQCQIMISHWNFTMEFQVNQQSLVLQGIKPGSMSETKAKQLSKLISQNVQLAMICVSSSDASGDSHVQTHMFTHPIIHKDIAVVFYESVDVFVEPTELPPFRDIALGKIIRVLKCNPAAKTHFTWLHGQLRRKSKLMMGKDLTLRLMILHWLHSSSACGHSGWDATLHRVKVLFYWIDHQNIGTFEP